MGGTPVADHGTVMMTVRTFTTASVSYGPGTANTTGAAVASALAAPWPAPGSWGKRGAPPTMNLNIHALDTTPTTCVQITINAAAATGGLELAKIDYSLDGGTNFTNVPTTDNPFTFIAPGSGSFHLVARAFDAAGQ